MTRSLLALALLATHAGAGTITTWNCSNPHFEAGCSETECQALPPGDFTPMSISFTSEGFVYACMYSGCWEGDGDVFRSARFLSIHASQLTYSTDPEPGTMRNDIALLVDLEDNITLMKAGGYAQPLVCKVREE